MTSTVRSNPARRGNTIVLVTAILVLLVIIATAFISRTQSGRALAGAQQRAFQREDHAQLVAEQVAAEVAQSLFPKPIDPYYQHQATPGGYADELAWMQGGGHTGVLAASTWSGVPRSAAGTNPLQRFTAERFQPDPGDFIDTSSGSEILGTDGVPDGYFDFNFAPYETRPWTNWPDDPGNQLAVPSGPGAPFGLLQDDHQLALGAGNPHGNPGFGDSRWLRETEPRRIGAYYDGMTTNGNISQNSDPYSERFSHWTHLSWIPTAENGWRVCYDIANVAPLEAYDYPNGALGPENGNTLSSYAYEADGTPYANVAFPVALQTPYEQWYSNVVPQSVDPYFDGTNFYLPSLPDEPADWFASRRDDWFGTPQMHFAAAKNAFGALPNFIDLTNLRHGEQFMRWKDNNDTGQDDDVANQIAALRDQIERTYCDTDGDGFTDSFWFVPPTPVDRGVRQVVGVSVIDNASMLDANVATIFDRWSTSGTTPSDLALVGRLGNDALDTHVGFFADPKNTVDDPSFYPSADAMRQRYRVERWEATPNSSEPTFLNMRGLSSLVLQSDDSPGPFFGQYRAIASNTGKDDPQVGEYERRIWNRAAQRDGQGAFIDTSGTNLKVTPFTTTPFGIADELELRAHAGQNHPTSYSRFERAVDDLWDVGNEVPGSGQNLHTTLLRSTFERQETTPVRLLGGSNAQPLTGTLSNEQLARDLRHRLTLVSGTRNELRPMWLWATPFFRADWDYDRDGEFNTFNDFQEYERRKRKIDLRQSYGLPTTTVDVDSSHPDYPATYGSQEWLENQRLWLDDLQDTITRTTTVYGTYKADPTNASTWRTIPQSYFTNPEWDPDQQHGGATQQEFQAAYIKSLKMAASYAANIEAFRDSDNATYSFGTETVVIDPPLHPYNARRVPYYDPNDPSSIVPQVNGQNPRDDAFIGLEKQPFIMQAFYSMVFPKSRHGDGPPDPNANPPGSPAWSAGDTIPMPFLDGGEHYVDDSSKPAIIIAIQLGNPFHEPVSLVDFKLRVGSKDHGTSGNEDEQDADEYLPIPLMKCPHPEQSQSGGVLGGYSAHDLQLGPTEPEAPRTAIIFAVIPPSQLGTGTEFQDGTATIPGFGISYEEFKAGWIDFLDLEPGALFGYEENMPLPYHQTLVLDASDLMAGRLPSNDEDRRKTIFGENDHAIELIRTIQDPNGNHPAADVVLDRIQHERDGSDPRETQFDDTLIRLIDDPRYTPPEQDFLYEPYDETRRYWSGVRLGTDDFFLTWARVSRIWGWDVDASGMYDMDEISPRYAFSLVSGPDIVDLEDPTHEGNLSGPTFQRQDFFGHSVSIADMADGQPDQDPWITREYVLPVTRLTDVPTNDWTWRSNPPNEWLVRGKPTNFPTWTVLKGSGNAVEYGLGFPIETTSNTGDWSTATGYVLEERTDSASNFAQKDVIPMDLCASEQSDFHDKLRKDVWSSPLQMLLKNDDFEQIGELNHVFLWGPVFNLPLSSGTGYPRPMPALRTFAELMTEVAVHDSQYLQTEYGISEEDEYPVGYGPLANRLDVDLGFEPLNYGDPHAPPRRPWRQVLGAGRFMNVPAYRPKLPAGVGLFDAVTVDGRGLNAPHPDLDGDGFYATDEAVRAELDRYDLVRGYSGNPTKGLINVNTAPIEVMRAMPQMSRLVYNDYFEDAYYGGARGQFQRSATGTPAGEDRFGAGFSNHMHIRFGEAIERYRLGDALQRGARDINEPSDTGPESWVLQPSMADRGYVGREFADLVTGSSNDEYDSIGNGFYGYFPGMRNERGIISLGELLTMQRTPYEEFELVNGFAPSAGSRWAYRNASVRGLALEPYSNIGNPDGSGGMGWGGYASNDTYARERFRFGWRDVIANELPFPPSSNNHVLNAYQADARVSTDRNTLRRTLLGNRGVQDAPTTEFAPDIVGGDAEEMNLLFSGIANMLTTRSDVFTIYLKVRTFKQDPATGIWDASKENMIIDESRYVMIIDRSQVDSPTDKPRILAFAKVE